MLGYFYFSLNIEGKGKRDEHIISQIIFTRCFRLTLRTSKMSKKIRGAYSAPQTPSWHARLALPASIGHRKSFQTFLIFLVDMPEINYYAKKIRTDDTKFIEFIEKKINKNLETYNIKKEELETLDKNRVANLIQKNINIKRIASLKIKGTTATKTKEMSNNINTDGFNILPPAYITKLPRHLAGIIFKTRSYMLKIRTNMKTTNPDLSCRWYKQYQETQEHIITECTMTPDIDIDINKAMTNHKDTLIKEATQLTQIVNLLDKPPDTDVQSRHRHTY